MATIVQPYNPWKEQLALTALGNVAGNIIGDIWKTHRQNEQNRKANAFRGQLQQDLQNNAQPEISLIPKEAPQGYNSNPWANAFHQNNSPLTAFDIGTSTVGKTPSIQDIMRGADNLAASKRFSMLSPELVQGVKNSMIQQAENQRLRDLQNNFADMFGSAKSPAEQMNILVQSVLQGAAPYQALTAFSPFAAHMSPHKQAIETNLEDSKRIDIFDSLTGKITPGAAFKVGVSPNTAATVAGSQNVARINAGSAENVARIHALGDEARAQATIQAQQLKIWQEQHNALRDEIANDTANLAGLNEKDAIAMQSVINQKKQRLAQLEQLMSGAYSGTGGSQAQTTQADLGDLSYWGETSNGMGKDINGKPFDYSPIINNYAKQYGIDPDFAAAVMKWESGGNAGALSNKGAIGPFQLMPGTAQQLGVNPHDVEDNIKGGIMYLRQMLDKYNGNAEMALRAYNAGPGATDAGRYPAETQKYVPGVLGIYRKFRSNRPHKQQATATQTSTPQQQPQTQPQGANTDRAVFRNKDGQVITKSQFDDMVKNNGEGLGAAGVAMRLRDKGFTDVNQNAAVVSALNPALNWSPNYMGGIPQGQAFTAPAQIPAQNVNPMNVNTTPQEAVSTASEIPPFPNNFRDRNRRNSNLATRGNPKSGYASGNIADWINRYANNENNFRPPLSALGSSQNPNNKSSYSFTGNAWQGLLPAINGGFSDIPRFNALTPEDLQSAISGSFYYPYYNGNIFGDDITPYMPPMSVLNSDQSKLFMLNAARNALRRGRF